MESFYNLLRIILMLYLGCFTYTLYQILFYYQKRFLFLKTISFFYVLAVIIIRAMNKYSLENLTIYLVFYFIGLLLTRKYLAKEILKRNRFFKQLLLPLKTFTIRLLKIITIPPLFKLLKKKLKLAIYYKKNPHLRPLSIYELF